MKTILLSLFALLLGLTTQAQNCVADFDISNVGNDYTFTFTGNQPTGASVSWYVENQYFTGTTVNTTLNGPAMPIISCTVSLVDSVNNLFCTANKMDTLFIAGATNSYCSADFSIIQDSSNSLTYYVVNQSTTTSNLQYLMWDFGDGYATNNTYPSHNYANVGTYVISLFIYADSCWAIATDTLVVTSKATGTWVHVIDPATLDVKDPSALQGVEIYPNPLKGEDVNLVLESTSSEELALFIYDAAGVLVKNETYLTHLGTNHLTLDTKDLNKGIYYLNIRNNKGGNKTIKMAVQ